MKYYPLTMLLALLPVVAPHAEEMPLIPLCVSDLNVTCGLVNKSGSWIVPPKYKGISFGGDIWLAEKKLYSELDTHFDILNKQGVRISSFQDAKKVSDDVLIARDNRYSPFKLYHYDGSLISETEFEYVNHFYEGVGGAIGKSGLWGYIDKKGQWIIKPQYETVGAFDKGLATVRIPKMKLNFPENMVINHNGKVVMPYRSGYEYTRMDEKYWQAKHSIIDPDNEFNTVVDKSDIVNNSGSTVKKNINVYHGWENGIAFYNQFKNGKEVYGIFDTQLLKVIVPAGSRDWEMVNDFVNGVGSVRTVDGWKDIDTKGNVLFMSHLPKNPLIEKISEYIGENLEQGKVYFTSPLEGANNYRSDGESISGLKEIPPLMWVKGTKSGQDVLINNLGDVFLKNNKSLVLVILHVNIQLH